MTTLSDLPQSRVFVHRCADCPFAAMRDGERATCQLDAPPESVAVSLATNTLPSACPLKLGPVDVRLGRGVA